MNAPLNPSSILGKNNINQPTELASTSEGYLKTSIASPILPFGSIHTENLTPIFQSDAVYGINQQQAVTTTTLSGGATTSDSLFQVSTGTTQYSQAVIQSRKRLRYRAGQGIVCLFTAKFTSPVADSYQLAGLGHAEDGVYVGYKDADFGILYVNRGVREVRTLTVTVGATSAANCTITLNGVAFTVALTAASNIQRTVYEISQATYAGWTAYPSSSTTVTFVRGSAGAASDTYSFGAGTTGAAASIAQAKAGVASTDLFIKKTDWNGDKLDGTGDSGVTIDTTKLNIFRLSFGYLGADAIVLQAKVISSNGKADFVTLHSINLPNTLTSSSFRNPSLPFSILTYSAGSTTNLTVSSASFAGFIEGRKFLHGGRFSYFNSLTTVGATNFQALFTILNSRYYKGVTSQCVINILGIAGALKHTSPCIFYLIKNGTLAGNPSFSALTNDSCSLWDTSATTVTYSDGYQLLWTGHLGDTGEINYDFSSGSHNMEEITLQPGEWITLAAKAVTGTPSYVTGSINTREDQ